MTYSFKKVGILGLDSRRLNFTEELFIIYKRGARDGEAYVTQMVYVRRRTGRPMSLNRDPCQSTIPDLDRLKRD